MSEEETKDCLGVFCNKSSIQGYCKLVHPRNSKASKYALYSTVVVKMFDKHIVINFSGILAVGTRAKAEPLLRLRANSGTAFIVLTGQEEKSNGGDCWFNITYRYVIIKKYNQLKFFEDCILVFDKFSNFQIFLIHL